MTVCKWLILKIALTRRARDRSYQSQKASVKASVPVSLVARQDRCIRHVPTVSLTTFYRCGNWKVVTIPLSKLRNSKVKVLETL